MTSMRIWQRGERMNSCKMGKQRTDKNILKAKLGKKKKRACKYKTEKPMRLPWQRCNSQVFKSEIMMPGWVLKVAPNFCKNTSVAQKTCWTEATAGPSRPSPWCYLQRLHRRVRAAHAGGVFVRRNRAGSGGSNRRTRT